MKKIQWHPTFCSAIRLEFRDYPTLEFTQEYNLSTKPIQVDMLIIKKPHELQLKNSIGEFFKGFNIIEYKLSIEKFRELVSNIRKVQNFAQFNDAKALLNSIYNANEVTLKLAGKEVESMDVLEGLFGEELAERDAQHEAKGRLGLIAQFIKDYGVEKAKTMLKPSDAEIQEALNML